MAGKKSEARLKSINKYAESLSTIAGEILGMSRVGLASGQYDPFSDCQRQGSVHR